MRTYACGEPGVSTTAASFEIGRLGLNGKRGCPPAARQAIFWWFGGVAERLMHRS